MTTERNYFGFYEFHIDKTAISKNAESVLQDIKYHLNKILSAEITKIIDLDLDSG